ncbi:hypothetical protein ABIA32_000934 [Streptacidiphilus sp. MAP12-20]|uniref:hypothetical protein n=1 Tax=Streptacidiphilus sp. MAP12-20 TaxID=3156299 RepID=UPI003516B828
MMIGTGFVVVLGLVVLGVIVAVSAGAAQNSRNRQRRGTVQRQAMPWQPGQQDGLSYLSDPGTPAGGEAGTGHAGHGHGGHGGGHHGGHHDSGGSSWSSGSDFGSGGSFDSGGGHHHG